MTHIRLTTEGAAKGAFKIAVDGVDVSSVVLFGSVKVLTPRVPGDKATVTMTLIADQLEVDLPDAVVKALQMDGSAS